MDDERAVALPPPSALGERLQRAREVHGWTQRDVADLLDTTQQSVHRWESGHLPNVRTRRRLELLLADLERGRLPGPSTANVVALSTRVATIEKDDGTAEDRIALARSILARLNDPRGVTETDLKAMNLASRLLGLDPG